MTDTFACDVSYYQAVASDSYPHRWIIFRACDGNFRDPHFAANLSWAKSAVVRGRLDGYTVYGVYRPETDFVPVLQSMVGTPDAHCTVMIDAESWGGAIRGDHSSPLNSAAARLAAWLGDQRRVLGYGNGGDLAALWPNRPGWLRVVVAAYSSVRPSARNMIGWQYTDGQSKWPRPSGYPTSSPPFGNCDHNVFPNLTSAQLAEALGVGTVDPLEQIMQWYTDRPTYEAAMQARVAAAIAAERAEMFNHASIQYKAWRGLGFEDTDGVDSSISKIVAGVLNHTVDSSGRPLRVNLPPQQPRPYSARADRPLPYPRAAVEAPLVAQNMHTDDPRTSTPTLSDQLIGGLRTGVPALVGALLTFLAVKLHFVISPSTTLEVDAAVFALVTTAYRTLLGKLEQRWKWVGVLLGYPAQPTYSAKG